MESVTKEIIQFKILQVQTAVNVLNIQRGDDNLRKLAVAVIKDFLSINLCEDRPKQLEIISPVQLPLPNMPA